MDDKELDLLNLLDLAEENGALHQSPSSVERRLPRRYWPLSLIFLLGISVGWFFYEFVSKIEPHGDVSKESLSESKAEPLSSKFDAIVFEIQDFLSQEKKGSKRKVSLRNGENLTLKYGRSELRYRSISLKRGWLKSLFSKSPGLFLDGQMKILPNEDIVRRLEPEKSINYRLTARFNQHSRPLGDITITLQMSPAGWHYRISLLQGKPEKQRLCYEKAEESDSINTELLIGYAELLKEMKQDRLAAQKYESLLEREPENLVVIRNLSALYLNMKPREGLNLLRKLIQLDSSNKVSHYRSLAQAQQRLGFDSAWKTYKTLLDLNPGDTEAIKALDEIYIGLLQKAARFKQEGKFHEAIRAVEESRKIYLTGENSAYLAKLLYDLGYKMAKDGKYNTAVLQYKSSIEAQPNLKTYLSLAKTYNLLGKTDEAIRTIRLAKKVETKDAKTAQELLSLEKKLLSSNR